MARLAEVHVAHAAGAVCRVCEPIPRVVTPPPSPTRGISSASPPLLDYSPAEPRSFSSVFFLHVRSTGAFFSRDRAHFVASIWRYKPAASWPGVVCYCCCTSRYALIASVVPHCGGKHKAAMIVFGRAPVISTGKLQDANENVKSFPSHRRLTKS